LPSELDRMVSAIQCAELNCIRYRGSDRLIQLRLVETGEGEICDSLPPDVQQRSEQVLEAQRRQRAASSSVGSRLSRWWRGGRT
jgi:hypothetical protein